MKWRKNKKTAAALPDPDQRELKYPSGAPLIAGGDKVYAVYTALNVALSVLDNWKKHAPKQAAALSLLGYDWKCISASLRPYCDLVEEKNLADEDDM